MKVVRSLDEPTFEALFRAHFKEMTLFAITLVKEEEAAREIVQEAFVNLWEKRSSIDLSRPVKSYLSTSVRNRCINYLRDHRKFSRDLLAIEEGAAQKVYDQADKLVESEIREKIAAAVLELPEKCREVFLLSRHEQLRYQEIADKLGISVKTVETQMSKALQHLRIRLGEYLTALMFLLNI